MKIYKCYTLSKVLNKKAFIVADNEIAAQIRFYLDFGWGIPFYEPVYIDNISKDIEVIIENR